jgi:predicted ATPase/DNA-binding XRE family transcriptional regulator
MVADQPSLTFAELLRQLRATAGLTQEELAEAAGLSTRSVSDWERGINRTAHKDTAMLLAAALSLAGSRKERFIAAARGKVLPTLPNNLPAELTAFIGRNREVSEVRALVGSSRLVTLTGPGGAGKTRLAHQVASGFLGEAEDGVWLVELAVITEEDEVPSEIAEALRIPSQPARAALDVLADALVPQDVLIVLDNCEHLIGGCAKTADTLLRRCPKLKLMATSREPLDIGGETVYRVPSLSLPEADDYSEDAAQSSDAVRLLADRAGAQGVRLALETGTLSLAVSVCRRLDGMPLAIELAAARLRSMSLRELSDRLDQRFQLLTGGSRGGLARQRTLREAIGWSYSLLTAAEQVLLRRLSVFTGGFDIAATEAVCGFGDMGKAEVAGLLGPLVDKSLVIAQPAGEHLRYRLLETIRIFAADRLAEAGPEETAAADEAHCWHYLAVAEGAAIHLSGPDQGRWHARLDVDRANVRRAAQYATSQPDGAAKVLRFGVALWRYWTARNGHKEAAGLLVPVLRDPKAAADPKLFAEAQVAAALFTAWTDSTTSLQLAGQAAELARQLGSEQLLIQSLAMLCLGCYLAGDMERALLSGQESVARARKLGDDVLLGLSFLTYLLSLDSPSASGPLYAEAIACTERSGDLRINAYLHNEAGLAALQIGDITRAKAHLEAGIQAAKTIGDSHFDMLVSLSHVRRAEHDLENARSTLQEVLRGGRRIGSKSTVATAVLGLACLSTDLSDWHRAALLHGIAQAMLDQTGLPWQPFDARCRQQSLDQLETALGSEQLRRAYTDGMTLSLDRATDLALA